MVRKHGPNSLIPVPLNEGIFALFSWTWLNPWLLQPTEYGRTIHMQLLRLCRFCLVLLKGSFSRTQPTSCEKPKAKSSSTWGHLVCIPARISLWLSPAQPPYVSEAALSAPRCPSLPSWGPRHCGAKTRHPCCAYLNCSPRIWEHHKMVAVLCPKFEVVYCIWWLGQHFY